MVVLVISLVQVAMAQVNEDLKWEEMAMNLESSDMDHVDMEGRKRIAINQSRFSDWNSMGVFNNEEINRIMEFIRLNKPLSSVYQLQLIEGISITKWNSVRNQLTVYGEYGNDAGNIGYLMSMFNFRLKRDFRQMHRMRWKNDNVGIGLLIENDTGEKIRWDPAGNQYGFDHYSLFYEYRSDGILEKIIIGDFTLNLGEGLVFGNGFGLSKGMETITSIKNKGQVLRPFTSSTEYGYMRGVATQWQMSSAIQLISFLSTTGKDATLTDIGKFSSVNESGLHISANERRKKWNMTERTGGMALMVKNAKGGLGCLGSFTQFSKIFDPVKDLRNMFEKPGRTLANISVFGEYTLENTWTFAEVASSINDLALSAGLIRPITRKLDMALSYRWFGVGFNSLNGSPFADKADVKNERGLYMGLSGKWGKRWTWSSYIDIFVYPWLRYQVDAPGYGTDWLGSLNWRMNRNSELIFKIRKKQKEVTQAFENNKMEGLTISSKWNYWLYLKVRILPQIEVRQRIQGNVSNVMGKTSSGNLFSTELIGDWKNTKISARIMNFETDAFDNREYIYERDVLYGFSIPFYYQHGWRYYYLQSFKFKKRWTIWMKFSETLSIPFIDNNNKATNGNKNSQLKIQLQYKL